MLPNLGALRLTVPTSELFPITERDEENNGGEPFEDPSDYEELPLNSETRTFRVEKVPDNPERGYNWHDARNLAEWVKRQIEDGKFPVVDPLRTPMSKSDIDQLRFEVDQDIPPYDPSIPPPPESDEEDSDSDSDDDISLEDGIFQHEDQVRVVRMGFSVHLDLRAGRRARNEMTASIVIDRAANDLLFEDLRNHFMRETQPGIFAPTNLTLAPVALQSNEAYDTIPARVGILWSIMRRLDASQGNMEQHRSYQNDLYGALNECGRGTIFETLHSRGLLRRNTTVQFSFNITHASLTLNWKFVSLPFEFFSQVSRPDVLTVWRAVVWDFKKLFKSILETQWLGLDTRPRDPIYRRINDAQWDGFFSMKNILHYDVEDL